MSLGVKDKYLIIQDIQHSLPWEKKAKGRSYSWLGQARDWGLWIQVDIC